MYTILFSERNWAIIYKKDNIGFLFSNDIKNCSLNYLSSVVYICKTNARGHFMPKQSFVLVINRFEICDGLNLPL